MASAAAQGHRRSASRRRPTSRPAVFGEQFHESLVHEAARADLAARRRGTASTLGRGEVSMTTAKAWRQKGTGRARVGALSVPHRRGGGAAFGPKPRHHTFKVNRKARRRALRAALSVHAARGTSRCSTAARFDGAVDQAGRRGARRSGARKGPTLVAARPEEAGGREELSQPPAGRRAAGGAAGVADVIGARSLIVSEARARGRSRPARRGQPRRRAEEAS